MNRILFILLCTTIFNTALLSQNISGKVYGRGSDGKIEPLELACVFWKGGSEYAYTDAKGNFTIAKGKENKYLIAFYIGFSQDTLDVSSLSDIVFELNTENTLEQAIVSGKLQGTSLSKLPPVKTEVITSAGLNKMACCNIAESFENSASVSVGYSDAVTGARQIRLLGLSGIYMQMLDENRPTMRGILTPFGLEYIPGQWLESIQIAKGPSSVINGYESITGQINMEFRKPFLEQPLFLNLFLSHDLRTEINATSSLQLNNNWSTIILAHGSMKPKGVDGNNDGFYDEPLTKQLNVANRWLYISPKGPQVRFGFRALSEERTGGQVNYDPKLPISTSIWGSQILNKGINGYLKVGIPLKPEKEVTSAVTPNIAFVLDYTYHDLASKYGFKTYNATQNSLYANMMILFGIGKEHRFNFGINGFYDNLKEYLKDSWFEIESDGVYPGTLNSVEYSDLGRKEGVGGIYGEYTLSLEDKFMLVLGGRVDYNFMHGWLFTPRANIKYSITPNLVFRASAGKGYRSPNIIADNIGIMATGRQFSFDRNLGMEEAWTYGANLSAYFPIGQDDQSTLSFEYFRSDFTKQIIIDQELDKDLLSVYTLDGPSYTNTYQIDFTSEPWTRFTILATFRYTDAKVSLKGQGLVERPLMSRYKAVLNFQYALPMNLWIFDITGQLNGPSRLPNFASQEYSPVYPMLYAQVTRKFRGIDVYLGAENILNYMQHHCIYEAENPFDKGFNATVIWGPLMGYKIYAGLRYTLWK